MLCEQQVRCALVDGVGQRMPLGGLGASQRALGDALRFDVKQLLDNGGWDATFARAMTPHVQLCQNPLHCRTCQCLRHHIEQSWSQHQQRGIPMPVQASAVRQQALQSQARPVDGSATRALRINRSTVSSRWSVNFTSPSVLQN